MPIVSESIKKPSQANAPPNPYKFSLDEDAYPTTHSNLPLQGQPKTHIDKPGFATGFGPKVLEAGKTNEYRLNIGVAIMCLCRNNPSNMLNNGWPMDYIKYTVEVIQTGRAGGANDSAKVTINFDDMFPNGTLFSLIGGFRDAIDGATVSDCGC